MQLTALTWNIHKAIGGIDRRYRPERVIEVIAHHAPDICLLQEVDEGVKRSNFDRQVDLIGDAVGLRHRVYGPTHVLRGEGHYGNAILSRWPIHDVHSVDLTIGPRKVRGCLYAKSRVRFGRNTRSVAIYNLHLGLAGSERKKQLRRFLDSHPFQRLHQRTPVVFGGDLNDVWATLGPKLLEPAGFRRAGEVLKTFPAVLPVRPLDGIFVRGDLDVIDCHTSDHALARAASDHLPLVAHLEVNERV